jgi:hypothetical protein
MHLALHTAVRTPNKAQNYTQILVAHVEGLLAGMNHHPRGEFPNEVPIVRNFCVTVADIIRGLVADDNSHLTCQLAKL